MRCVLCSSLVLIGLGFAVVVAGCGPSGGKGPAKTTPPSGVAPQKPAEAPKPAEPKQAEAGAKTLPEGLAELPEADRALAEKQKVCPVSGEPLGSMGKPVKITVKGKTVFLCCSGCEPAIKKDPDKYLAKLDAAGQK
jgi:YHS domain-containing protein